MATFKNAYTGRVVDVEGAQAELLARARKWVPVEAGEDLSALTVLELRDRCRDAGLPVYGSKGELIGRLEGDR